jgi:hypothetical protein
MKKPKEVKILQWVYLLIFLISFGMIVLMHAIPKPFLDIIRMPTYIRAAEPFLKFPYDASLLIYQITLLFFVALTLVDSVSLFFFSSKTMKKVSALSSFVGFILIGVVFFYFLYSLALIGLESWLAVTALIYLMVSIFLMVLDLYTFEVDEELLTHIPASSKIRARKT